MCDAFLEDMSTLRSTCNLIHGRSFRGNGGWVTALFSTIISNYSHEDGDGDREEDIGKIKLWDFE